MHRVHGYDRSDKQLVGVILDHAIAGQLLSAHASSKRRIKRERSVRERSRASETNATQRTRVNAKRMIASELEEVGIKPRTISISKHRLARLTRCSESSVSQWPSRGSLGDLCDLARFSDDANLPGSSPVEQATDDSAFTNAYKAIEAIVGDPSKDGQRFRSRIAAARLDPDVPVGYGTKRPLIEVIRRLNEVRDTRTAHGTRSRKAPITKAELVEVQQCARYVVFTAVRSLAPGRRAPRRAIEKSPVK